MNWRQRYYKVRARKIAADPAHEWRTLSAYIDTEDKCKVILCPSDAQITEERIEEL